MSEKTFRCKTSCGLSVQWRVGQNRDGKWKATGLSNARYGRDPIPLDFIPYELSSAVMNGPSFDTQQEAEIYVRNL